MILNYTSTIEPEQTIGEIQKMLSRYHVSKMMTDYNGPEVSAVSFQLLVDGKVLGFRLPCNWRAVRVIFDEQKIGPGKIRSKDKSVDHQAQRTAWRVIKDWIEAQLALVEINMTTVPQVFLPYAIMRDGRTLSEHVAANPDLLLDGGK